LGSAYTNEKVVGNDLPVSADRLQGVPEGGVDAAASEGPPADLILAELDAASLRGHRALHALAFRLKSIPSAVVQTRWVVVREEHAEDALAQLVAEELR